MRDCTAALDSIITPGHTHRCSGEHDILEDSHWCADCKRWFWTRASDTKVRAS